MGVFTVAKVQLMGLREYARHRGCAVSAVAKAINEGRISVILDEQGRKRIDPEVADIQWEKNTRARADSGRHAAQQPLAGTQAPADADNAPAAQETAPADPAKAAYHDTRALTEAENLRQKRRENMVAERQLAEVVKVRRTVFDAFRALRDKCLTVPQRAAPRCIGLADAREIERVIAEEVRGAFAHWEDQMEQKIPTPEGLDE